ncbi:MAG: hypothetical protein QME55_08745 [Brevundimonas sp.]|uniref:hypothetical protein n=1 Tax=Brevundimonas sp. TaxID=1871086 RepID=UPI002630719A|nr:hypothetical protein [Brevundimonas sp.]MDI6624805.1 hypothetical protein [Brevundimonas sp.]MDQ7812835.1 hypothetical protein [Brevundimonas sp.]
MHIVSWVAFSVGWLKGGHAERFAVVVLVCDYVFTVAVDRFAGGVAGAQAVVGASGLVITACFLWLTFRSDRWWPLAGTGCLILIVLVHLLFFLAPVSYTAAVSAQVGLWLLLYVIVLAGVAERWLAGEAAVSRIGRGRAHEAVRAGAA